MQHFLTLIPLACLWANVMSTFDAPTVAEIEEIKAVLTTAYRTDTAMMVDAVRLGKNNKLRFDKHFYHL